MLRLFQGSMYASHDEDAWPPGGHGPVAATRTDLARLEVGILVPLVALMFLLGLYPQLIAQVMPALAFPITGVPWH
jgi:NADH:ubiquinone oxidoreductase subunit 4 (subunit M)